MAANRIQRQTMLSASDLREMIEPDEHRPRPARARLRAERIPVWAIVGYIGSVAGTTEPQAIPDEAIAQVAAAHEIPREAVQAAVQYYSEHRAAIDGLLEANAAAIA